MLMGSALLPFAMAALLILASSESFMPASSESTLDVVETVIAASPRIALNHPDPFRLGSKVSPRPPAVAVRSQLNPGPGPELRGTWFAYGRKAARSEERRVGKECRSRWS